MTSYPVIQRLATEVCPGIVFQHTGDGPRFCIDFGTSPDVIRRMERIVPLDYTGLCPFNYDALLDALLAAQRVVRAVRAFGIVMAHVAYAASAPPRHAGDVGLVRTRTSMTSVYDYIHWLGVAVDGVEFHLMTASGFIISDTPPLKRMPPQSLVLVRLVAGPFTGTGSRPDDRRSSALAAQVIDVVYRHPAVCDYM